MKKNFLLIATLAGLVSTASAASPGQPDSEVFVLPTYVVTAPRDLPAEQQINARLKEFRQTARSCVVTLPAPSLPKFDPVQSVKDNPAARAPLLKVAAKL